MGALIGAVLNGRYRLDAELGRGTMGIILNETINNRSRRTRLLQVCRLNALRKLASHASLVMAHSTDQASVPRLSRIEHGLRARPAT